MPTMLLIGTLACLTLMPARGLRAEEPAPSTQERQAEDEHSAADTAVEPETETVALYVPPRRGAPNTRVGGGTRAASHPPVQVELLAPEHTGFSASASPTLYWWLSEDHEGRYEFVVTASTSIEPELRIRRDTTLSRGLHAIDLQAEGVELTPGVIYQWSVAIVQDEESRSHDVVAVATLQRADEPARSLDPVALAAAGLWYDAIARLSAAAPAGNADAAERRRLRAALLEQVGLEDVARWDRGLD